jgi:hypothetical protein
LGSCKCADRSRVTQSNGDFLPVLAAGGTV